MTSVLVSPPATEPVNLSEVKDHLRVDGSDEDSLITGLIGAAVDHIDGDGVLGRAMITQSWAEWVSQAPGWVRLPIGPFQSLVSVEYYDSDGALQAADVSEYETRLDGDHVIVKPKDGHSWPPAQSRQDAIKITYEAGFGDDPSDVPHGIRQAMLLLIGHWYECRKTVSETTFKEVPMTFHDLINRNRVGWYG